MALEVHRDVAAFGDKHAIVLSNGEVELIASTGFGPRVLRYAFAGGENVFGIVDAVEDAKPTPFGEPWRPYGGHRLWHAPEDPVRTYVPDNGPVRAAVEANVLVLSQAVEEPTGLKKELRIALDERGTRVFVSHRIRNAGKKKVDLAVWALSLMAPGGTALLPNPPFAPHPDALLPARRLVTWPYTSLGDRRFRFGDRFLRVTQDPTATSPQKIGLSDGHNGWAAYVHGETVFIKRYPLVSPDTNLVDLGCNVELFTDAKILELETLGPQVTLSPGGDAEHVETWELFRSVSVPEDDEKAARILSEIALHRRAR